MTNHVLEIARFDIEEGTDISAWLEAAATMTQTVRGFDGYVSRRLTRDADGRWRDVLEWRSMEAAQAAAGRIMQEEAALPFMKPIIGSSVEMLHVDILHAAD